MMTGRYLERSGRGQIEILELHLAEGTEKIYDAPAEIPTEQLPNLSLQHYRKNNLLGILLSCSTKNDLCR
jgi:hypothetical protein